MNTTITSNGLPVLPQPKGNQGTAAQPATGTTEAAPAAPAAAADDSVKLTDSARALHEAAKAGADSGIDTKRVEQVRQALANGSYKIDAGRIADGLLSLEGQISGKP